MPQRKRTQQPAAIERWTIRICKLCGGHHGRLHDGCVTHSHPMYPQVTEHAGVDEVEVVPAEQLEGAVDERDAFARALRIAVASPALREAYVTQAKDSLARERGR